MSSPVETDQWLTPIASLSEMGALVRDFDWASTPLGALSAWPAGLRMAVSVCLSTRFPMLVVWGPDLTKIYNDGYRTMLGSEKHPRALGAPARDVWPEIWDLVGPLFDSVMTTGVSTWTEDQELLIDRNGFSEQCYFTYSYSPLFDGESIAGAIDLVTETTRSVLSQRRFECLSHVTARLTSAEQVTDVCSFAAAALSDHPVDVTSADIYLRAGDRVVLVASNRRDDVAPLDADALRMLIETWQPVVFGGGDSGNVPATEYAVPIGGAFGSVQGVLVASLSPFLPFDDSYRRFVHLIADALTSSLDGAYRRSVELGEYRRISDTLQASMVQPSSNFETVAARYLPAVGNLAVGGDWYDVIDLGDERRGLIVGDCVGHGLAAATVMAQLRSASQAMILDGRDPAAVLNGLDAFAASIEGASCATVVCAIFDRRRAQVTYSRAGHPPPVVVNANGVTWLDQAGGPPLAISLDQPRTNSVMDLAGDDVIVLYSDGLIERRRESLDVGLARLAAAVADMYQDEVQDIADGLLRRLLPENTRDDVALVVKRLPSSPT